jgi:renalase
MVSISEDSLRGRKGVIVGGGISGLIAATVLQRAGIHATVLDKGRAIGGRLATRRIRNPTYGEGTFDYGAQFFSVSCSAFQSWIDEWEQNGVVKGYSSQLTEGGMPCYQGSQGNRSLAQYLAKDLCVFTQTRVIKIIWQSPYWLVQTDGGDSFVGDFLVITSPIPQSLVLLDCSDIVLPKEVRKRLEQVIYQRCIAILALLEKPSIIPDPGGLFLENPALAWMACNLKKGISKGSAVTLHAPPEFSEAHWESENSLVAAEMLNAASPWLESAVVDYQIHRWRYSRPITFFGDLYFALREPGLLLMAGDAFSGDNPCESSFNVERAVISGSEAAGCILGLSPTFP